MTDTTQTVKVRVQYDDTSIEQAQARADKLLDTLRKVENVRETEQKRRDRQRRSSWGGIGRAGMVGAGMMGAGVIAGGGAALHGSLPGLIGATGVATVGAMRALGATVRGLTKAGGTIITAVGAGGAKGLAKMLGKNLGFFDEAIKSGEKAMAAAFAALGVVASQRMSLASQRADFEKAGTYAGLSGAGIGKKRIATGVRLGMTPAEMAAQISSASMTAGMRGSLTGGLPLATGMSFGASAAALGQLAGAGAAADPLNRGSKANLRFMASALSSGVTEGLRGARLTAGITQLAGTIDQLAQQGIRTDRVGLSGMAYGITKSVSGAPAGTGLRAAASLARRPAQARAGLLSGFQQASDALMIAEASRRGGGGFEGILSALGSMGAEGALAGLRAGGDVGRYILAAENPLDVVDQILGATPQTTTRVRGGVGVSAGIVAQERAAQQAKMLETMKPEDAKNLIKAMSDLTTAISKQVGNIDKYLAKIPAAIKEALD